MKNKLQKWRLVSLFAIMTLILAGCGKANLSTLIPAGEVAQQQYDLMVLSTLIMVAVIIVVIILFVTALVRFRRKKGDNTIPKQVEGSHKLEIIWTVIPIILLIVLTIPVIISTFDLADTSAMEKKDEDGKTKGDVIVVNVRANLFWWEFEYPDLGIVTSQDLVVPTDEKVYFNLTASDVKHSFWVPAAGGKMDTNVDGTNQMYLVFDSDKSDDAQNLFYGKCAELCGPSHAYMDFKVVTKSRTDFDSWAKSMQAAKEAPAVEGDLVKQGEEIFQTNSCIGCHAVSTSNESPVAARIGPNLANFGDRTRIAGILPHDEESLKAWIKDPEEFKPGNTMSGKYDNMTEEQLDALAEYLMSLKVENE